MKENHQKQRGIVTQQVTYMQRPLGVRQHEKWTGVIEIWL